MGLIPYRVLNDCIHEQNYTLKCDCGKTARFVGLFVVGNPDFELFSKEALFLCSHCAAMVDAGVSVYPLSDETVKAELDSFAMMRRGDLERVRERKGMTKEERAQRQAEQRRRIREADPDAWRARERKYHARYRQNMTEEQREAKRERDRARNYRKKMEREQQRMVGDD